ncbi:MAG: hypothetical protein FWD35_06285 [Oscillospiraceae bacterium]|nr:hypothetical protein [Oscillospiraceae bacterium]
MNIQVSELKANPVKYFDIAKTVDVIVTRHGQRLGRIVCEERAAKLEKLGAFDELMQCFKTMPSMPDNTVYDEHKETSLRERGLLE